MAHIRRGRAAQERRRQRALVRWQENQARNYAWLFCLSSYDRGFSDPNYVNEQMTILRATIERNMYVG